MPHLYSDIVGNRQLRAKRQRSVRTVAVASQVIVVDAALSVMPHQILLLCILYRIIVVELLLLICTWEFNTEQKLTRKYKLLLLLV